MIRISTLLEKVLPARILPLTALTSEEIFAQTYLSPLPRATHIVLSNLLLEKAGGGTTQVDHIVISQFGIFVIEAKNHRGKVWGLGHHSKWRTYYEYADGQKYYEYQNPLLQNFCHTSALKHVIPIELHSAIVSLVSFTETPYICFKGNLETKEHIVVSEELSDVILSYRAPILSEAEVQRTVQLIQQANRQSPENHIKHVESLRLKYPHSIRPISV